LDINMKLKTLGLALLAPVLFSTAARAAVITFEDLAPGAILGAQYAGLGVLFSANAFSGANSNSTGQNWATNTNMGIVASSGSDVGSLGAPALVSGNILHSFSGWLSENGDASFEASFTTAVTSFSADFAGVSIPEDTAIYVFDGARLLGTVVGSEGPGQFTLSYSAPSITRVVLAAGSFADWVGVDNIRFTPVTAVPEPGTFALLAIGLIALSGPLQHGKRR
jgi:PEP-CTERM motif